MNELVSLERYVSELRKRSDELQRLRREAITRCGSEYMPFWLDEVFQAAKAVGVGEGRAGQYAGLLFRTEAANDGA